MCCLELICASKRIYKNPDIVGVREEWAEFPLWVFAKVRKGHKIANWHCQLVRWLVRNAQCAVLAEACLRSA
jgi:hypothetical protein